MTTPPGHPEQEALAAAREAPVPSGPAPAELRVRVAALAAQVRGLANGSTPAPAGEAAGAVAHAPPSQPPAERQPASADGESLADASNRLLADVIAMAELAAAEIRAGAEREAAGIRERASAAIRMADEALERYRLALGGLAAETEHVERAIAGLQQQARALDEERRAIEQALRAARRRDR